jgi:hypothetical protein
VRPALSVVFDPHCTGVCGFCFSSVSVVPCSRCQKFAMCANCRGVGGEAFEEGADYDLPAVKDAAEAPGFPQQPKGPARLVEWHQQNECANLARIPAAARRGDTSVMRVLLRYRALTQPMGPFQTEQQLDWADDTMGKEPVHLLAGLQGHAVDIPAPQLRGLAVATGLAEESVSKLIYQIRTNAAAINTPNVGKVGCALSGYMGFTNHDCDPSAQASVDDGGFLSLRAQRDISAGEELTISYVDVRMPYRERQMTLMEQYKFKCACARCLAEAKGRAYVVGGNNKKSAAKGKKKGKGKK